MAALKLLWKRLAYTPEMMELDKSKGDGKSAVKEDIFTGILAPFESYVVTLQSILIWEKPLLSALAFTLCNILFWIVVYGQYRFYFVIAFITSLSYIYRTWTRHIWPEIRVPVPEDEDNEEWTPVNPQVLSVPEIGRYLNQITEDVKVWMQWLINLRHEHPGRFCIAITGTLMILCFIGRCVSGIFISYVLMCLILVGPGFFVHFYPHLRHAIINCEMFNSTEVSPGKLKDDPVEEFFPEANEEMIDALATALESSLIAEQEEEDSNEAEPIPKECEEFAPSLNVMPSYDNNSDSETEVEDAPLQLSAPVLHPVPLQTMMRFVSSHYEDMNDSDEDEEAKLAEGLVFGDDTDSRLREISPPSSSEEAEQFEEEEGEQDAPPAAGQQKKPPSRRPSQQSDVELSDYEMISESELS